MIPADMESTTRKTGIPLDPESLRGLEPIRKLPGRNVSKADLSVYEVGGVRVAVTGAKGSVFRVPELEAALTKSFTPDAVKGIKLSAAGMNGDLHGSADYRVAMIVVMAGRAVAAANSR